METLAVTHLRFLPREEGRADVIAEGVEHSMTTTVYVVVFGFFVGVRN